MCSSHKQRTEILEIYLLSQLKIAFFIYDLSRFRLNFEQKVYLTTKQSLGTQSCLLA